MSTHEQIFSEANPIANPSFLSGSGDRKRTLMRYIAAVEELNAALRLRRPGWETFEFPKFDVIPESNESLVLLQEAIEEKLNASHDLQDKSIWQKGKMLAERLFVALSPFAKIFLIIAREASQSVCAAMILTLTAPGCRDQELWDKAISLHEKVLQARTRLLGEEHPDTLMAMSSLVYSYMGSQRWNDATSLLTMLLEARTALPREEHMDTLVAMSRIGHAYSDKDSGMLH